MLRALVVGGGIAGLSAGIALRRAGHAVHVYEQSHLRREVGAAINVPPNASRFLMAGTASSTGSGSGGWGLDPVRNRFVRAITQEWRDPFTAQVTTSLSHRENAARFGGAELWLAHRVDLHSACKQYAL